MTNSERDDPLWNAAWEWIVREHEHPLDAAVRAQLVAWLAEDPSHRKAHEEAARVWLLAGLVPPSGDDSDNETS